MPTYERFDIIKVPFPFTERKSVKPRPALILSVNSQFNATSGHCVMAMITTAKHSVWPLDTPIKYLLGTGLPVPSLIRMKLFTLDQRLILAQLGTLDESDRCSLTVNLKKLFKLEIWDSC